MDQSGGDYPGVSAAGNGSFDSQQQPAPYIAQPVPQIPQPNSFDMVSAPLAAETPQEPGPQYPAQPEDPLVTTDTRPAWQQQIYSELSGGAGALQQPVQGVQQPALAQQPIESAVPVVPQLVSPVEPAPHFQISYESSTGEPVANPRMSGVKKVLLITLMIVVPIAILGGSSLIAYTTGKRAGYTQGVQETKQSQTQKNQDTTTQDGSQDGNANDEAALNFELSQPTYTDEVASGIIGEQLQLSDGFVLLVKNIERDFQPTNSSYEIQSNKELIKVNVLVGNADATQPKTITNQTFALREPSGALLSAETEVGDYEGQITTLPVSPGGKVRMSLVFSVEQGATPLIFVREQAYNLRNRGVVVAMNIEVDLGV